MRKLIALAAISAVIITAAYFSSCKGKKPEPQAITKEDSIKQVVERGAYLANHVAVCIDCHSIRDTGRFSMPVVPGTEGGGAAYPFSKTEFVPGEVMPPNITPAALKNWTDDDCMVK